MRYSKSYRWAVVCLTAALITVVYVSVVAVALAVLPSSAPVLGMSRFVATLTLLFVPTITGVTLILGIDFWYTAKSRMRIGWAAIPENSE
ncbi:MAG: hypothetical protein ACQCN4_06395 [Candidatus Bathyarchaeia archaeon]|jgi:sterol desaturase/sphingolipid hydroxylase (fatty acid hydroxylase superfamily)